MDSGLTLCLEEPSNNGNGSSLLKNIALRAFKLSWWGVSKRSRSVSNVSLCLLSSASYKTCIYEVHIWSNRVLIRLAYLYADDKGW